ncbi:DNA polymerase zeta catalytic subunit isoform X2 [Phoenix dactylifera]|uniref:DNA polymerase n=1 Tax=Phoenix dactylifera TaxID=42345 RepID=A0A8B7MVT8_PHODC|nr:DNA polymerase zeta catalytic subunit isoform X2 [Phoenix dactylifera]
MAALPPPNPHVFSVRIVSLDYYMASPIPDLDFCYSNFHGRNVEDVPVIRIYGSTPAGQKTCLHIHRALPYLYIPFPVELLQNPEEGNAFLHDLMNAIEKALKSQSTSVSKRQHIHGCSLVRAKKFYGYHSSEELFVKMYLYYPHEVARAATLLLGGAVLNRSFQPYETHIPYLLHFLVDFNLYGMSHIHTSNVRFRPPLPDSFFPKVACFKNHDIGAGTGDAVSNSAIWLSSTVPSALIWPDSATGVISENNPINFIRRQSICMLEADSSVDDILNEKHKMYTSLSQTRSDVRMVQSLIPIWEEEYERSGIQEAVKFADVSKPHPEDVLKSFLLGLEHENALSNLFLEAQKSFPLNISAVKEDKRLEKYITSFTDIAKTLTPIEHQRLSSSCTEPLKCSEESNDKALSSPEPSSKKNEDTVPYEENCEFHELTPTVIRPSSLQMIVSEDLKSLDTEALGLLSWLASSQAVEDLTTDDELVHEAILSPLFPTKSYQKALEMAHQDYLSASQQECQDILDSVEGTIKSEVLKENTSCAGDHEHMASISSGDTIPQVDGSSDDNFKTPCKANLSEINTSSERETSPTPLMAKCTNTRQDSIHSRNKLLWCPLPFSVKENEHEDFKHGSVDSPSDDLMKNGTEHCTSSGSKGERSYNATKVDAGTGTSNEKVGKALAACSVRDLMRKKRCFQGEQSESDRPFIKSLTEVKKNMISEGSNYHVLPLDTLHVRSSEIVQENIMSGEGCKQDVCTSSILSEEQVILHSDSKHICKHDADVAPEVFAETHISSQTDSYSAFDTNLLQTNNLVSGEGGAGNSSVYPDCKTCSGSNMEKTPLECIEMTFGRKPPSKDQIEMISEDFPGATGRLVGPLNAHDESSAFNSCSVYFERQGKDDILPFFERTSVDTRSCRLLPSVVNPNFGQDSAAGAPTHFQNDGSVLYLLTHAFSPPTSDSVCQWLLEEVLCCHSDDATGDSEWNLPLSSPKSSFKFGNGPEDAGKGPACDGSLPESKVAFHLKPDFSPSSQEIKIHLPVVDILSNDTKLAGNRMKENAVTDSCHASQISGPDGKSDLTPLSQIGFRDPASVGCGQQLTIMSLEVQAASRGDLRPDPRFDAINIISVAVQEDTSPALDIYVLMRGNDDDSYRRNIDGVSGCNIVVISEEKLLLNHFVKIISSIDPDVLMGWEIQGGSLGFLAERAAHLGISLLKNISRTPAYEMKKSIRNSANPESCNVLPETSVADTVLEDAIIEDEWGRTHASGIHVGGRIVLNIWRLMRAEVKLNMYAVEAVSEEVLRRKIPSIPCRVLNKWFSSGPGRARYRCIEYVMERAKLNLQIMNQLDMINRTSELARVFGIDFFSVLSRGSQFRVESMLLRLAHTQNYLTISPGKHQVASQPAMECLPLVMEPESGFFVDPVVVLDFQSLYPSMIIAYNLCFCTCLGKVVPSKSNVLGVSSYSPDPHLLRDLKEQLLLTPNGFLYIPSKVRKGVLPRLLEEILSTRIMVKQAMKKLRPSQQVLQRIFNARQLALKLIANVTYGYTAAGFSGRMPCAELADSIVQCGRRTLETAISYVNANPKWKARVVYGDTDSMFVLLKGRSVEEAFRIGNEIASAVTAMNPNPVTLKLEKVYQPCFLLSKKRYVGYSYESPDQKKPTFDAKGIETVRRDTCPAVAKTLEQSIRLIFEHQDISRVKSYLLRQWTRILSGKVSLQDFIFAKEVRLGTYSVRASSLPPAAIVAIKAMNADPRAEPRYGERIPYVVIHGEPGARLIDMVVDPSNLLEINSPYRLNDLYYINKQIIPALQRVFGLLGADLNQWFLEMPRPVRPSLAKRHCYVSHSWSSHDIDDSRLGIHRKAQTKRSRIDTYYITKNCILCGELVQRKEYLCDKCSEKEALVATAVVGKTSKSEREIQHLTAICMHCGGGDWILESGVKCTSLACSVFYERRKVQKELQALSTFAAEAGLYPSCRAEWF